LEEAIYYVKFAIAAFGWAAVSSTFGLSRGVKEFLKHSSSSNTGEEEDKKTICEYTGVTEQDIILCVWKDDVQQPAHYVALAHDRKTIVISIRGSKSYNDIVTDLNGKPVEFYSGTAHEGMAAAAFWLSEKIRGDVEKLRTKYPDYQIIITGHSLGAVCLLVLFFFFFCFQFHIFCFQFLLPRVLELCLHLFGEEEDGKMFVVLPLEFLLF
jgi:sn1-specific diacylglycerol lipase